METTISRPGASAQTSLDPDVVSVVDRLSTTEGRSRRNMIRRLLTEALATRNLWDLQKDQPMGPSATPPRRPRTGPEQPAFQRGSPPRR